MDSQRLFSGSAALIPEMYMVPVAVFRDVGNRSGALIEWVSGDFTEADRAKLGDSFVLKERLP